MPVKRDSYRVTLPAEVPEAVGRIIQLAYDLDIDAAPSPAPHVGKISLVFYELAALSQFLTTIANNLESVPDERFKNTVYLGMSGQNPEPWTYRIHTAERNYPEDLKVAAAPSEFVAVMAVHIPQAHVSQVQAALERAVHQASVVVLSPEAYKSYGGEAAFRPNC